MEYLSLSDSMWIVTKPEKLHRQARKGHEGKEQLHRQGRQEINI
jgi:hypothetical protein